MVRESSVPARDGMGRGVGAARKLTGKATNNARNVPAKAICTVSKVAPTTVCGKVLSHQRCLLRACDAASGNGSKSSVKDKFSGKK
jgi:hypothetical protein